jgi:hypothetical protein
MVFTQTGCYTHDDGGLREESSGWRTIVRTSPGLMDIVFRGHKTQNAGWPSAVWREMCHVEGTRMFDRSRCAG